MGAFRVEIRMKKGHTDWKSMWPGLQVSEGRERSSPIKSEGGFVGSGLS
ncbi:hypothetical protein RISK_004412 [Rhodopirellula islandica]|uniref:Uncharacterized protein n=1 Tax=Rhodopirellula islandica TaxID=595434 RepID=A0A0J1B9V4_RHOIS|nr:hypothetical protein RISK_004412 [Rhodopirellula islandica]